MKKKLQCKEISKSRVRNTGKPYLTITFWSQTKWSQTEILLFVPIIISGQGKMVCWLVGGKCDKKELSQINYRHFKTSNWTNTNNFSVNQNHPRRLRPSFRKFNIFNIFRLVKWLVLYLYFLIQHLCICVQKLNLLVNVVTMRRRKARKI